MGLFVWHGSKPCEKATNGKCGKQHRNSSRKILFRLNKKNSSSSITAATYRTTVTIDDKHNKPATTNHNILNFLIVCRKLLQGVDLCNFFLSFETQKCCGSPCFDICSFCPACGFVLEKKFQMWIGSMWGFSNFWARKRNCKTAGDAHTRQDEKQIAQQKGKQRASCTEQTTKNFFRHDKNMSRPKTR